MSALMRHCLIMLACAIACAAGAACDVAMMAAGYCDARMVTGLVLLLAGLCATVADLRSVRVVRR